MKTKESLSSCILKYALYAAFAAGVLITVTLPRMIDFYAYLIGSGTLTPDYRAFIIPFLIIAAIPGLWIILEMIRMMRTISEDPFVMSNVRALNRIGRLFFLLVIAFLVRCFFFLSFLALVCIFFFIGCGLFAFTLAAFIRQSVIFREENDLTI